MAAELAEARASSDETEGEIARLRAEADAKQQELQRDFAARVESQAAQLRALYDAEMKRVQLELDSTRRGRDLVQAEMESLRRQYEAAMFSVENSVPSQRLEAERERLRSEYETNMKVIRDELEAMKTSRQSVQAEMENLKEEYEARLGAAKSSVVVASSSISSSPLSSENLTDEMKIGSVDGRLGSTVAEKNNTVRTWSSLELVSSVQSKLVTSSLDRYSKVSVTEKEPTAAEAEKLERDAVACHEAAVSAASAELEGFRRTRDELAKVIYRIKTEYQDSVSRAAQVFPEEDLDEGKQEIRAKFEGQMDRVKDDLHVLKAHRDVVTAQRSEYASVWKKFEEERQKISEDVEAGKVERRFAPRLIKTAAERYFDEYRRVSGTAAADRQNVLVEVINGRFEREERRIIGEMEDGKLTETELNCRLDQLIKTRTSELNAAMRLPDSVQAHGFEPTPLRSESRLGEQASALNVNSKSSMLRSAGRTSPDGSDSAVARRLKTLEDMVIRGGRDLTDEQHCGFIREKLRREKLNAEQQRQRVEEAHKSTVATVPPPAALYDVFASAQDEIAAKTTAIQRLRAQNDCLDREISDIQAPCTALCCKKYNSK